MTKVDMKNLNSNSLNIYMNIYMVNRFSLPILFSMAFVLLFSNIVFAIDISSCGSYSGATIGLNDTIDNYSYVGNWNNPSNSIDENWTTYAGTTGTGEFYFYENYTVNPAYSYIAIYSIYKSNEKAQIKCYDGNSFLTIFNGTNDNSLSNVTSIIPTNCSSSGTLEMLLYTDQTTSGDLKYYESGIGITDLNYRLVSDILNSGFVTCLNMGIGTNLNCQNYKVDGIDIGGTTNVTSGILAGQNTIIINCYSSDWYLGFNLGNNSFVQNSTADSNIQNGFSGFGKNITVRNSTASSQITGIGIGSGSATFTQGCENCNVFGNTIINCTTGITLSRNQTGTNVYQNNINVTTTGINLLSQRANTFGANIYQNTIVNGTNAFSFTTNNLTTSLFNVTGNNIYNNSILNTRYSFSTITTTTGGNTTGNNIYNNSINISSGYNFITGNFFNETNSWNNSGYGNYYGYTDRSGYSDICLNLDNNSFCDNSFNLNVYQIDYFPLTNYNYTVPSCSCDSWSNSTCFNDTHRTQLRDCTPDSCDIETQYISDNSCIPIIPPSQENTYKGIIIFVCMVSLIILLAKSTNRKTIADNFNNTENIITSMLILGIIIIMVFLGLSIL